MRVDGSVTICRSLPGLAGPDLKGKNRSPEDTRTTTALATIHLGASLANPRPGAYTGHISGPSVRMAEEAVQRRVGVPMNEWVIVAIVAAVVIFGATKLPEIARNLGRSSSEFKKGLKEGGADAAAADGKPETDDRAADKPAADKPAE